MKNKLKIIFMGTPDFAVPALKAIHEYGFSIPLVVTQPDRPKGRGRKMIPTPVKKAAIELGLDIIQPESVNNDEFVERVRKLEPDIIVVVAFGQILKKNVLDLPAIAPVNIHASLLPKYRGAAPIQWAILNGEKESGVTIMKMDTGLDTGDILLMEKIDLSPCETSESLHDRLSVLGAKMIVKTIDALGENTVEPLCQDDDNTCYASMLFKKDGQMDWDQTAEELDAFVRGMTPWPGAFTFIGEKRLKVFKVKTCPCPGETTPGQVIPGFEGELRVATGRGALSILEIQGSSGKRLPVEDFLRGFEIPEGSFLS